MPRNIQALLKPRGVGAEISYLRGNSGSGRDKGRPGNENQRPRQ